MVTSCLAISGGTSAGAIPAAAIATNDGVFMNPMRTSSRSRVYRKGSTPHPLSSADTGRHFPIGGPIPAGVGHLADSRIPGDDEVAGSQRRLLEIRRVGRNDLPAGYVLAECLDGSHVR